MRTPGEIAAVLGVGSYFGLKNNEDYVPDSGGMWRNAVAVDLSRNDDASIEDYSACPA